jgi:hypothetical protein
VFIVAELLRLSTLPHVEFDSCSRVLKWLCSPQTQTISSTLVLCYFGWLRQSRCSVPVWTALFTVRKRITVGNPTAETAQFNMEKTKYFIELNTIHL